MKTMIGVIGVSLLLAGCGGGGGGGSVVAGGGGASIISDWLGTDPNAVVTTSTNKTYDLRHGTPDSAGGSYAQNFNQGNNDYTFPASVKIFGAVASSSFCNTTTIQSGCGPTLGTPHKDVIEAWNNGWTGKGVNVLIVDDVFGQLTGTNAGHLDPHASIVAATVLRNAWGTTLYGINYKSSTSQYVDIAGNSVAFFSPTKIGVINASFGYSVTQAPNAPQTRPNTWTAQQLQAARDNFISSAQFYANRLINGVGNSNVMLSDAVITKSAGNDAVDAQYDAMNYVLAHNSDVAGRLLIVGALAGTGYVDKKTDLATSYTNVAGTDSAIQSRFLLASGTVPFNASKTSFDGLTVSTVAQSLDPAGTSFAAPRVAGYAAIIRQKFPNLTAANTADILLQTARYDTLSCYPDCVNHKEKYGQGEASLSHALAPFGALH